MFLITEASNKDLNGSVWKETETGYECVIPYNSKYFKGSKVSKEDLGVFIKVNCEILED